MNARTHQEIAGLIWRICNLLRGAYKRNEYRKVILPLTVLRRFDCAMEDTRQAVRRANETSANLPEEVRRNLLLTTRRCLVAYPANFVHSHEHSKIRAQSTN